MSRPVFTRINNAINFTREYFHENKLKEYLLWFVAKARNPKYSSYLDDWDDFILKLHNYMEDEIIQTVNTCNNNTQVYLFEELRRLINEDWQFSENINENHLENLAYNYNDKLNTELELKVEDAVQIFRSNPIFLSLGQNEEYEEEVLASPMSLFLGRGHIFPSKRKVINRKYYCIEFDTEFLDYYQLPKYIKLLEGLVSNFRKIVSRHLILYDSGKYVSSRDVIIERKQLADNPEPKLLSDGRDKGVKQKINLSISAKQLLSLFQILIKEGIVTEPEVLKEFHEVIAASFSTGRTSELSVDKLQKLWSEIKQEPELLDQWSKKFLSLHETANKLAKKYNQ
jgi:hypothetical protein